MFQHLGTLIKILKSKLGVVGHTAISACKRLKQEIQGQPGL